MGGEPQGPPITTEKPSRHFLQAEFFAIYTSEVDDLIDNEGVLGVPNRAASSIVGSEIQTAQNEGVFAIPGLSEAPLASASYSGPKIPEQLSVNCRAVLRKSFSKASPVVIPMGHPLLPLPSTSPCYPAHNFQRDRTILCSGHERTPFY